MKRVYWVTGAENSGNRMMVQCLCSAGCWGNPHKGEVPDVECCAQWPDHVAFARSVPQGDQIPNLFVIAQKMIAAGFTITPILIYRKTDFAIAGQVKGYPGRTPEQAADYIHLAARMMYEFAAWLQTPLVVVSYELFVLLPEVRRNLFAQLGLPEPTHPLFNANEKYALAHAPLIF